MNFAEFLTNGGPILTVHLLAINVVAVIASFLARRSWFRAATLGTLILSCLVQLATMVGTLLILGEAGLERGFYLFLLSWGMLITGMVFWLRKGLAALSLIVMPVALLICLISLFVGTHTGPTVPTSFSAMFTVMHVGALLVSFCLIGTGFGAGLVFLAQEKHIKSKAKLSPLHRELPNLSSLDRANAIITAVGFPLYSIGLLFGFIGARFAWGTLLNYDPKELVSIICWVLFAWLFHQRLARDWKGHKPAVMMIILFLVNAFSLFGVNFFMNTHHGF